jgi:hypothetical protein
LSGPGLQVDALDRVIAVLMMQAGFAV